MPKKPSTHTTATIPTIATIATIGLFFLGVLGVMVFLFSQNWPFAIEGASAKPAPTAVRILRLGHNVSGDSALHQAALRFADLVEKRSHGRVKVQVFPARQLGNDDQMLEMTRSGQLDMVLIPTAKISTSIPAMQYADLPFYFPERQDLYDMLDGEPGQILLGRLKEIDVVGVTFWENGFKHFTGHRPFRVPADFVKANIRTMKSRLLMEQFKSLGANPIPIDFYALRKALADKVVDGQENPLVAIVSMGLHEVQSHLTLSSHGYLGYVFMISAQTLNPLPIDLQKLLTDTAKELTPWEREETHRREVAFLDTIRQAGITIHELTPSEREKFVTATAYIPRLFEEVIGADVMARTEELLDQKYGAKNRIVIGLDADLSQDTRVAGLGFRRGIHLAIEKINAAGGVLGRPLQLVARDHKGMPSLGMGHMQSFIDRPEVVAVLGGVHSSVVVEQKELAQQSGMPFLQPWSAVAGLFNEDGPNKPDFTFRLSANDVLAAPFIIDYLLAHHQRPAILFENTVWGRRNLEEMQARLQKLGLNFVHVETFNRGQSNYEVPLRNIEKSGADAVILIANAFEGGHILRSLAQRKAPLRVVSHWGISSGDFWSANREALSQVDMSFFQTFTFINNLRPQSRSLAEQYQRRYGTLSLRAIPAPQAVAQAHDMVYLLAQAITKAGSTNRAAVRDALEKLPLFEGAVKRYAPAFTPQHHEALGIQDYRMARFANDGSIVTVGQ